MKRNFAWIIVCVMMLSSMGVLAQPPVQPADPYRLLDVPGAAPTLPEYPRGAQLPAIPPSPKLPELPSTPQLPRIPPNPTLPSMTDEPLRPAFPYSVLPNLPYNQPTMPGPMPYHQPMAPGHMPYANPQPGAQQPAPHTPISPNYLDGGPQPGATEPYFVQPEPPQPGRSSVPTHLPEARRGNMITDPMLRLIDYIAPPAPSEPYTMYEGRRYAAEMKQDNIRLWAQASFIHWWVRRDAAPPLVTTGNPVNPNGGALGNPDTRILLGNGAVGPGEFSGLQATLGLWLDPESLISIEIGGFWLGRNSRQYRIASDANGNPLLAQPVIAGGVESALPFARPGEFAGSFAVNTALDFHGLELIRGRNLLRLNGWTLDSLLGIRYLYLNDTFDIRQDYTGLAPLPFNGGTVPAGSDVTLADSFNTTNRFYGGTIGARVNWTHGRFDLGAILKVSFGATSHVTDIYGSSTATFNGASTTVPGGTLALASNSGRFTSTDFSVVPEVTLNVGYQVSCNLRVLVGYTALDWNRVQRAGNQIDRNVDFTQIPSVGGFAPSAIGNRPNYPANRTDFWAQGINVGMELKF